MPYSVAAARSVSGTSPFITSPLASPLSSPLASPSRVFSRRDADDVFFRRFFILAASATTARSLARVGRHGPVAARSTPSAFSHSAMNSRAGADADGPSLGGGGPRARASPRAPPPPPPPPPRRASAAAARARRRVRPPSLREPHVTRDRDLVAERAGAHEDADVERGRDARRRGDVALECLARLGAGRSTPRSRKSARDAIASAPEKKPREPSRGRGRSAPRGRKAVSGSRTRPRPRGWPRCARGRRRRNPTRAFGRGRVLRPGGPRLLRARRRRPRGARSRRGRAGAASPP